MKLFWIIAGVLSICSVIILNLYGPMKRSVIADFSDELQPDGNPLQPCPDSPNCIRISKKLNVEPRSLFDILPRLLAEINAEKIKPNSQHFKLMPYFVYRYSGFGMMFRS